MTECSGYWRWLLTYLPKLPKYLWKLIYHPIVECMVGACTSCILTVIVFFYPLQFVFYLLILIGLLMFTHGIYRLEVLDC